LITDKYVKYFTLTIVWSSEKRKVIKIRTDETFYVMCYIIYFRSITITCC